MWSSIDHSYGIHSREKVLRRFLCIKTKQKLMFTSIHICFLYHLQIQCEKITATNLIQMIADMMFSEKISIYSEWFIDNVTNFCATVVSSLRSALLKLNFLQITRQKRLSFISYVSLNKVPF